MSDQQKPVPPDDKTIPSRPESLRRVVAQAAYSPPAGASAEAGKPVPWALAQYFEGDIDLNQELAGRFPQMPLMSLIYFREHGKQNKFHLALISTQDGAASLRIEIDSATKAAHFTYTLNSMLALRFGVTGLSDLDRSYWLEPMKRENGEIAFLWGAQRFRGDYVIAVPHKMYTNVFAFSPQHTEAATRLTQEVTRKLVAWLEPIWAAQPDEQRSTEKSSPSLSW